MGTFAGVPRFEMLRSASARSIDQRRHDAVLAIAKDVAIRDDGDEVRTHRKLLRCARLERKRTSDKKV
jgi:hypothetical protein